MQVPDGLHCRASQFMHDRSLSRHTSKMLRALELSVVEGAAVQFPTLPLVASVGGL